MWRPEVNCGVSSLVTRKLGAHRLLAWFTSKPQDDSYYIPPLTLQAGAYMPIRLHRCWEPNYSPYDWSVSILLTGHMPRLLISI